MLCRLYRPAGRVCLQQLENRRYRSFETSYPCCQPRLVVLAVLAVLSRRWLLAEVACSLLPSLVDPGWHFLVFGVVDDGLVVGLLLGGGVVFLAAGKVVAPADLVFTAVEF